MLHLPAAELVSSSAVKPLPLKSLPFPQFGPPRLFSPCLEIGRGVPILQLMAGNVKAARENITDRVLIGNGTDALLCGVKLTTHSVFKNSKT